MQGKKFQYRRLEKKNTAPRFPNKVDYRKKQAYPIVVQIDNAHKTSSIEKKCH